MISSPTKKRISINILLVLLLALVVRLIFVFPQFSGDVKNHIVWGQSLVLEGLSGLFTRHFTGFNDANYPPLTIVFFGLSVFLYQTFFAFVKFINSAVGIFPSFIVPLFETENMLAAFLKLPSVLSDLGIGLLIYRYFKRENNKNSLLYSALYLFNPAVIYISSVWGQIESIPIFFLVLSFFLVKKNYFYSHLAFTLAILSKQTALWVLPVFLIIWLKEGGGLLKTLKGLLLQLVAFILIYLPFTSPATAFGTYLSTLAGSSDSITDQALNVWYFIYGWERQSDSILLYGLSVRLWSIILLTLSCIGIIISFIKKYDLKRAPNNLFLLSMAAFFIQTRVHDRHLAPVLPFLLLSTLGFLPKAALYVFLSAYHMFNLYLALRLPFI